MTSLTTEQKTITNKLADSGRTRGALFKSHGCEVAPSNLEDFGISKEQISKVQMTPKLR